MNRGRSAFLGLMLAVAVLASLGWAAWSAMQRAAGMTPKNMSGALFADAVPGAPAECIVEVSRVGADGELEGRLLDKDGRSYRRTSVPVVAQLTPHPAVVMGAAADIKPRAVLQLSGRFDNHHRVRVAQVVVLTGYVTVEP